MAATDPVRRTGIQGHRGGERVARWVSFCPEANWRPEGAAGFRLNSGSAGLGRDGGPRVRSVILRQRRRTDSGFADFGGGSSERVELAAVAGFGTGDLGEGLGLVGESLVGDGQAHVIVDVGELLIDLFFRCESIRARGCLVSRDQAPLLTPLRRPFLTRSASRTGTNPKRATARPPCP